MRRIVREEIALAEARIANGGPSPWMSTEDVAALLNTTAGAIRQRLASGWMEGHTIKEGRRRYVRRVALLAELERRRDTPNE